MDAAVLVICYGNPGRLDDGLGAAFGNRLDELDPAGVTTEVDYQLSVEHAAAVAGHRYVIFVDASVDGRPPFFFRRLKPGPAASFSTHSVKPEALLAIAGELFGAAPEAYALGIRGYVFNEFGETLSPGAMHNLTAALKFLLPLLEKRNFSEAATEPEGAVAQPQGEMKCKTESM